MLTQVINHATERPASILVSLTEVGLQPPELDAIAEHHDSTIAILAASALGSSR